MMDIWYTENHTDHVRMSMRVDKQLASVQSDFQRIDIFESVEFGRIMTLDGLLMLTEMSTAKNVSSTTTSPPFRTILTRKSCCGMIPWI
jgi:spermidine synthase